MDKKQPYIKSGETSLSMEEEVVSLVSPSTGYPYYVYGKRVGEMEENAKIEDGGDKALSIFILNQAEDWQGTKVVSHQLKYGYVLLSKCSLNSAGGSPKHYICIYRSVCVCLLSGFCCCNKDPAALR